MSCRYFAENVDDYPSQVKHLFSFMFCKKKKERIERERERETQKKVGGEAGSEYSVSHNVEKESS